MYRLKSGEGDGDGSMLEVRINICDAHLENIACDKTRQRANEEAGARTTNWSRREGACIASSNNNSHFNRKSRYDNDSI